MKSDTSTVQQQFQDRRQYRIPFYQRAYVWNRHAQWEPLWADILEKAESRLVGADPTPHFFGAIVLEPQKREGLRGVETFHVIDGQQRLSTLQYVLAAVTIAMREAGMESISAIVQDCIWNPNPDTMDQPDIEIFKVWPTFRDRENYKNAMNAKSLNDLRNKFPESFTQASSLRKIGIVHPPALEAIWFFYEKIQEWIYGDQTDKARRLEVLAESVLRDLKFVWIMLDENDDAQVIFETLNGRGAELHATDLIRNFIFLRADREEADASTLYTDFWRPFEDAFWTSGQRRGRLIRPRLEWFVQTVVQAVTGDEVEVGTLYGGYRRYVLGGKSAIPAETQLETLSRYSIKYKELVTGDGPDPIADFGRRIALWDASAMHSLSLRIACLDLRIGEQAEIYNDLLSYIVRRAVCGLTQKNYNKVFMQVLKRVSEKGEFTPNIIRSSLSTLKGDASRWPDDDEFGHAWLTAPAHDHVGGAGRVKAILAALEDGLRDPRTEEPFSGNLGNLDVDHILPTSWYQHWPIDGKVITYDEVEVARYEYPVNNTSSPRRDAILKRESAKLTFGNLTLVNFGINRSLQNGEFIKKRNAFFVSSNLHLNREIMQAEEWGELEIERRGRALLKVAKEIWRGPVR